MTTATPTMNRHAPRATMEVLAMESVSGSKVDKRALLALCAFVAWTASPCAHAQLISCGFVGGVTTMNFPNYTGFAPVTASTQIRVGCLGAAVTVPVQLKLSAGNAYGYAPRRMVFGANTLQYNLYLDAARTQVWGDGSGGTQFASTGILISLGTYTYTVYGAIPAGQTAPPGNYGGATVTATLTF